MELLTTFPDGTTVHAIPRPGADVIEQLHDVVHHLLAQAMGLEHSPSLWNAAHPGATPKTVAAYEETAVIAIQQYARVLAEEG